MLALSLVFALAVAADAADTPFIAITKDGVLVDGAPSTIDAARAVAVKDTVVSAPADVTWGHVEDTLRALTLPDYLLQLVPRGHSRASAPWARFDVRGPEKHKPPYDIVKVTLDAKGEPVVDVNGAVVDTTTYFQPQVHGAHAARVDMVAPHPAAAVLVLDRALTMRDVGDVAIGLNTRGTPLAAVQCLECVAGQTPLVLSVDEQQRAAGDSAYGRGVRDRLQKRVVYPSGVRIKGTAVLRLVIGADGNLTAEPVLLGNGSGHERMDAAIRRGALLAQPYDPPPSAPWTITIAIALSPW